MKQQLLKTAAIRLMIILSCSFYLTACSSLPGPEIGPETNSAWFPSQPEQPVLTLNPGDEIDVKFRFWPELDTAQTILPDGTISLQLVGHVRVAGLTPVELDQQLVKLYDGKILDPEITTVIRSLADQKIYVGGEVTQPGLIPLRAKTTVLEAIMASGGFNKTSAELSNVLVIRHLNNKRYVKALNLKASFENPDSVLFYLGPRDIVFVPRTTIDRVNQWVDQYINKIIPSPVLSYAVAAQFN